MSQILSKNRASAASLLCLFLFILVYSAHASAETFPPAVIGILDVQRIRKEAKAIVSIREQITAFRSTYEASFRQEESALRDEEQELARQRSILSQEAFERRNQLFRGKVQRLQQHMQAANQALQQSESEALREFNETLRPTIRSASQAQGVTVVLFASQVAFAPRTLDITSEVMRRLDAVLPKILVKDPAQVQ